MKEITITLDEERLSSLINAGSAYHDILWSAFLGTHIPAKFNKLKDLTDEEIREKLVLNKDLIQEIQDKYMQR